MNNAPDCTPLEVEQALISGQAVESGYGVDYVFMDILNEAKTEDLLKSVLVANDDALLLQAAKDLQAKLAGAATDVAIEIQESYKNG